MSWTLARAKDRLSDVVRRAIEEGPQTITVRGRDTAVIISKAAFDRLGARPPGRDFKQYLLGIRRSRGWTSPLRVIRRATSSFEISARHQCGERAETPGPNAGYMAWLARASASDLAISALTVGEVQRGVGALAPGKRRASLEAWVTEGLAHFADRILPVTAEIASAWATVSLRHRRAGRSVDVIDELIAATAIVRDLIVVTRDRPDFEASGCAFESPWS